MSQHNDMHRDHDPCDDMQDDSHDHLRDDTRASSRHSDDARMERVMGRLLQVGVALSSIFVLIGGVLFLRDHAANAANYRVFASEPASLRTLVGLAGGLRSMRPEAIIQLGVLLLIATPMARVVFALISFALERDRLYILVSVVILAVLTFGLLHPV